MSYNTSKESSQYDKCNGVSDGTISIMWQETLFQYTCQKLKCPSNATYKPHVPTSTCAHMKQQSIYMPYGPTAIHNMIMNSGIHHFTLLAYAPEPTCPISDIHPTALLLFSTHRPHITAYTSPKIKLQLLITRLLPYMWYQKICPSNTTYIPHIPASSCAYIRQLCMFIYLI